MEFAPVIGGRSSLTWAERLTAEFDTLMELATDREVAVLQAADRVAVVEKAMSELRLDIDDLQTRILNAGERIRRHEAALANLNGYIAHTAYGKLLEELAGMETYQTSPVLKADLEGMWAKTRTVVRKDQRDRIAEEEGRIRCWGTHLSTKRALLQDYEVEHASLVGDPLVCGVIEARKAKRPQKRQQQAPGPEKPKAPAIRRSPNVARRIAAQQRIAAILKERDVSFTDMTTREDDGDVVVSVLTERGWSVGLKPFVNGVRNPDLDQLLQFV